MLIELAKARETVNTAELGKLMLVSPKYLRKLAGPMEKHGLIMSLQGIHGGYTLARKATEITMKSVFDAFSERLCLCDCIGDAHAEECALQNKCLTRPVWMHIDTMIQNQFTSISIQNIIDKEY